MSSNKIYSASYQRTTSGDPTAGSSSLPDKNEITRAIGHPANFEPILVCSVVFIVVGLLMMVTGGVICLIYYTEITPPNFDSNYHRYVGSSMPRIVGPLLVGLGGFLSLGDLVVICLTVQQYQKKTRPPTQRQVYPQQQQPATAIKSTVA